MSTLFNKALKVSPAINNLIIIIIIIKKTMEKAKLLFFIIFSTIYQVIVSFIVIAL